MLEIHGLSKTFGGLRALNSVDVAVGAGSIVGLVGPNGSGKTTLLNVVTGYVPASSGSVEFLGQSITGAAPDAMVKLGLSRTFQQASVFPDSTVIDNVVAGLHRDAGLNWSGALFNSRGHRTAKKRLRERALAALEAVGLEGKAALRAGELGAGEQKHLGIAIAVAVRPKLLMLDEPAAGMGDAETARLVDLLRTLRDDGLSLVVVEHNMELIMGLCDRIVVLEFGVKIADGAPSAVRKDERVIEAYLGRGAARAAD